VETRRFNEEVRSPFKFQESSLGACACRHSGCTVHADSLGGSNNTNRTCAAFPFMMSVRSELTLSETAFSSMSLSVPKRQCGSKDEIARETLHNLRLEKEQIRQFRRRAYPNHQMRFTVWAAWNDRRCQMKCLRVSFQGLRERSPLKVTSLSYRHS
jgi:hypothetical protein